MASIITGLTDDNSAAISYAVADDATTVDDMENEGGKIVGSPSPADSGPFQEGEKVLAHFSHWLYEAKNNASLEKLVSIQIPPPLKKQLVDDCEFVTRLGKLVKLPRSPNFDEILKKYLQYRSNKDGKNIERFALPAMLLYKSEREQYQETVGENEAPSLVY